MNLRRQLAYNAEETCRLLSMMVLDALGPRKHWKWVRQPDNRQDSGIENL